MLVPLDPNGQDVAFPCTCGNLEALELIDHIQDAEATLALSPGDYVLPPQQEPHELLGGDRLDLASQAVLCICVDAREEAPSAPLLDVLAAGGPGVVWFGVVAAGESRSPNRWGCM